MSSMSQSSSHSKYIGSELWGSEINILEHTMLSLPYAGYKGVDYLLWNASDLAVLNCIHAFSLTCLERFLHFCTTKRPPQRGRLFWQWTSQDIHEFIMCEMPGQQLILWVLPTFLQHYNDNLPYREFLKYEFSIHQMSKFTDYWMKERKVWITVPPILSLS